MNSPRGTGFTPLETRDGRRPFLTGFTLIETVVIVALAVLLLLATVQLYLVYNRSLSAQKSTISVMLGSGNLADAVHTAALQADHVVASHTFSDLLLTTGTSTVVFELPTVDSSGSILDATFDYVGFYVSSTSAYRAVDAAVGSARASGTKQLTNVLQALTFTYNNATPSLVSNVTMDATTTQAGATSNHIRKQTYLRNL